uniref:Polymerase PA n=1 Tax=Hubei orthoptera virus 6 TaxID=1923014 RepID=A0A1L3KKG4_9VIRU|nr:polymerase PA [Hubei orthoptera virus 6]
MLASVPNTLIETQLIDASSRDRDWPLGPDREARILRFCVHYKVLALIADQYLTENGSREWEILEMIPRTTAAHKYQTVTGRKPSKSIPDLASRKHKTGFEITITTGSLMEAYQAKLAQVNQRDIIIAFNYEGGYSQTAMDYLIEEQRQVVCNFLINMWDFLEDKNHVVIYRMVGAAQEEFKIRVGSQMKRLSLRHTDELFVPDCYKPTRSPEEILQLWYEDLIKKDIQLGWAEMKSLPTFKIPSEPTPACWNALLIGSDSRFALLEVDDDRGVATQFIEGITRIDYKQVGNLSITEHDSFFTSFKFLTEQMKMTRPVDSRDHKGFGIKRKSEGIPTPDNEYYSAQSSPAPEGYPDWIEDELKNLSAELAYKWVQMESNQIYNEIDSMGEEIADRYLHYVGKSYSAAMIEKNVETASKIETKIMSDRNSISIIPIITRKPLNGKNLAQLWGFILVGPSHPKKSTDRIPLLTFEFCSEPEPFFADKYKKYTQIEIESNDSTYWVLTRKFSTTRQKIFYLTGTRKTHLQVCNFHSKLIMNRAAMSPEKQLEVGFQPRIDIFWTDGKTHSINYSTYLRLLLSLEYLMAVYNNSQLEAFCANIRRLHMARHALMEERKVFIGPRGYPEEKVQESIINNPVVLFLARTWNILPTEY